MKQVSPQRALLVLASATAALMMCSNPAWAQGPAGKLETESVKFRGNTFEDSDQLRKRIESKETPGFFNKFLHSINEQLGSRAEYCDPDVLASDIQRLTDFYRDKGFFNVRVDSATVVHPEDRTVDVTFDITEGYRSIIDSIALQGVYNIPWSAIEDLRSNPLIEQGDPYDRELLEREVERILHVMKNSGYAHVRFLNDSSRTILALSSGDCMVVMTFELGRQYKWGEITVQQDSGAERNDVTDETILQQLDYSTGEITSEEKLIRSERNLNRLGIFERARIGIELPGGSDSSGILNSIIAIRARDKHEFAPELLVSDENSDFNLGTGIGYTNRNFLGGARIFSTRLRFRTQTIGRFPDFFGTDTTSVANLDLTFEILQPYVFSNSVKGRWTFSFIKDKRELYTENILRNRFGFIDQFAEFTTGFLDWTLERSSLSVNKGVPDSSTDKATDDALKDLRKRAEDRQFNSILSFTIQRDKSFPAFSPVQGFIHSATFDESGILPLLLKKAQPDLRFTQFYRMIFLGRWYYDLSESGVSIFGLKLKAGFEEKYGESRQDTTQIPTTYRFYGGGGSSIRGWKARDLSASGDPRLGGNLSFEGSVELRANVFRGLRNDVLNKIWWVFFLDFGNVWPELDNARVNDVAIAGGIGLRYDTFFGPFRLDCGLRVYDPREIPEHQWIIDRPGFLKNGVFHFGIGHAF